MNFAPAGEPAAGGTDPAVKDTQAPQPSPDNNPASNDTPPADNNPHPQPVPWEVRVPEEYKKAFAPHLEKYQKMGLTPQQAQAFVEEGIQAIKDSDAKIDAELLSVKNKWGNSFDANQQAAVNAMAKLGFTTQQAAAMVGQIGLASVLERFFEISKKMNAGELKDGAALTDMSVMDAAAADKELERLTFDRDFGDKLAAGDAQAKERWERLKAIRRGGK